MFNDQRGLRHGKGLETGLSRKLKNDMREVFTSQVDYGVCQINLVA